MSDEIKFYETPAGRMLLPRRWLADLAALLTAVPTSPSRCGTEGATYASRSDEWRATLTGVLRATPAERVDTAYVPCAGGDVLSALAAFPAARIYVLASHEPPLPQNASTLSDALSSWRRAAAIPSQLAGSLSADLQAIFTCARGGGFMRGDLVRAFARRWGTLPLLLAALTAARVAVRDLEVVGAPLPSAIITCEAESAQQPRRRRTFTVRYVSADLAEASHLRVLELALADGGRGACVGALIKAAEATFRRGAEVAAHRQRALAEHVLRTASVVLQETQTGIEWSRLRHWATNALPLGAYVPQGAEARHNARAEADAGGGKVGTLRRLWALGLDHGVWRSLRGLRVGYCVAAPNGSGPIAAAVPSSEPPAAGERDASERGAPHYCSAVLAWRAGTAPAACGATLKRAMSVVVTRTMTDVSVR